MSVFSAAILGLVEGLTEFLPVSSTGHLILTSHALGILQTEFTKTFEIAIQSGAILAVVVLYGKKLLSDRQTLLRVLAAFLPTAIIGLAVHGLAKRLIGNTSVVIGSLIIGGIILILFEQCYRSAPNDDRPLSSISYRNAVIIGSFQALSIVPGVSRAAATIIGGLLLGLSRKTVVEFSFVLAIPTVMAATALDIVKSAGNFSREEWQLLAVGSIVSFIVALAMIRWLLTFIQNHSFTVFGVERIVAAIAALIFLK